MDKTYVCARCGGLNLHVQAYVDINTKQFVQPLDDGEHGYCVDCNSEQEFISVADWKNRQATSSMAYIDGKDVSLDFLYNYDGLDKCGSVYTRRVLDYKDLLVIVKWSRTFNTVDIEFIEDALGAFSSDEGTMQDFIHEFTRPNDDIESDLICDVERIGAYQFQLRYYFIERNNENNDSTTL